MTKARFQSQVYPWALIATSFNMTFLPGKLHPLHLAYLIYSQFYASIKDAFDAGKVFPLDNTKLEASAVDANLPKW